jgi:hypothetical protein
MSAILTDRRGKSQQRIARSGPYSGFTMGNSFVLTDAKGFSLAAGFTAFAETGTEPRPNCG